MIIKSIEMAGNKRLLPADIKYFNAKFNKTHQLILGLNGSGKSTTIQELNPLPATPADYMNGGYKKIVIEHQSNEYVLTSTLGSSNHHSFELNGVELNEGGTSSVQKTLVFEHFNLDEKLIEILTDQTRFHMMSPNERRNWLTRLSGTNMDYAISFFKHLKGLLRDVDGVIKHLDTRLAKESGDITTPEQLQRLEQEHKQLESSILSLLELRDRDALPVDDVTDKLKQLSNRCIQLGESIVSYKEPKTFYGVYSRDELIEHKEILNSTIKYCNETETTLLQEHSKLKDMLLAAEEVENKDLDSVLELRREIESQINDLKSQIKTYHNIENPLSLYGATDAIWYNLNSLIVDLFDNSEQTYTRDKMNETSKISEQLLEQAKQIGIKLDLAKNSKQRLIDTQEVQCPDCGNEFKPGVEPNLIDTLSEKITAYEIKLEKLKDKRDKHEEYLSGARSYINQYSQLVKIMKDTPSLNRLWDDIKKVDLTTSSPKMLLPIISDWKHDVEKSLAIARLEPELINLDGTIEKLKAVESTQINYTQDRLAKIDERLSDLNIKRAEAYDALDNVGHTLSSYDELTSLYNELVDITKQRNDVKSQLLDSYTQKSLSKVLGKMNARLTQITDSYNSAKSSRERLEDLTFQKTKAVHEREILKALVKELNPTDGLIAKQSKLFIEQFVEQLNTVIGAIWTYEMKVLPCPVESDKLTYKFPLYFPATDATAPDIAKSSAAQKSIVDFAFKLIVMAYLGLQNYPLYLDELAPSLDEKHRVNIMEYVRNFVESKQCSQLFMISHYHDAFGSFLNPGIVIMDKTNLLTLPDSYNEHVVISSKLKPLTQ